MTIDIYNPAELELLIECVTAAMQATFNERTNLCNLGLTDCAHFMNERYNAQCVLLRKLQKISDGGEPRI